MIKCLLQGHRWEPKATSGFRYHKDGPPYTRLLEICARCGERRENDYMGEFEPKDFLRSPKTVVDDLLREDKIK